jgi:ABC-type uncharacterized transport system involved in gliding motility auxiliary subunit
VTLRFYFSREPAAGFASLVAYAGRVRDLLQEYSALSGGRIILEEIDPAPFTQAEDDAVAQGLTGAPTEQGETVYFGLVGNNTLSGHEVVPFFDQSREQYLEYDLSSMIYKLSTPQRPKLGIMSGLPLETGLGGFMAAIQGNSQPFAIYTQLRSVFDVQNIDPMADRIPADITTLMVVHPAGFSDQAMYAIDQFVLRGGHAIVFVDPLSEILNNQNPGQGGDMERTTSNLPPLFTAWGIDFDPSKIVGDGELAQQVQVGGPGGPQVTGYLAWMRMTPASFNPNDPVTGNLQQLNIATAGALKHHMGATTTFTPLLQSSSTAALIDTIQIRVTQRAARPSAPVRAHGRTLHGCCARVRTGEDRVPERRASCDTTDATGTRRGCAATASTRHTVAGAGQGRRRHQCDRCGGHRPPRRSLLGQRAEPARPAHRGPDGR